MTLQPIESAPKDGRLITLAVVDRGLIKTATGHWSESGFVEHVHYLDWTHWCPLPTLEDDAELQAVKAELNERLHERTQAFLAREIRITKERDALRAALDGAIAEYRENEGDEPHPNWVGLAYYAEHLGTPEGRAS